MLTNLPAVEDRTASVWAVPPLCRANETEFACEENRKLVEHIRGGGITTLLWGGNAIFYHLSLKEYAAALELISSLGDDATWMIPSIGPSYGQIVDQAPILSQFEFPTAMLLPQQDIVTSAGVATATRRCVEMIDRPIVLYLKYDGKLSVDDAKRLVDDGLISAIKYAVVRQDHRQDDYLQRLVDAVGGQMILSGLGDQPAIIHMRDFGLGGFTTGCGCVAPQMSTDLLAAIRSKEWQRAEKIRADFEPLEDLRNGHGPITVLHAAVELAGIAKTGPVTPMLSAVEGSLHGPIRDAALAILPAHSAN